MPQRSHSARRKELSPAPVRPAGQDGVPPSGVADQGAGIRRSGTAAPPDRAFNSLQQGASWTAASPEIVRGPVPERVTLDPLHHDAGHDPGQWSRCLAEPGTFARCSHGAAPTHPLPAEEVVGRDRSALVPRRAAGGFPTRKTFDDWGPHRVFDPAAHPDSAALPGMAPPPREPDRLCTLRHRQYLPVRGAGSASRRTGAEGGLVRPRRPRRAAPTPCRRHRYQGHRQGTARRLGRRGRFGLLPVAHRPAEGFCRWDDAAHEKRSIASNLPPPVRRADVQNPGHRRRRPAAAPHPGLPNQRRFRPAHPSPSRSEVSPLTS